MALLNETDQRSLGLGDAGRYPMIRGKEMPLAPWLSLSFAGTMLVVFGGTFLSLTWRFGLALVAVSGLIILLRNRLGVAALSPIVIGAAGSLILPLLGRSVVGIFNLWNDLPPGYQVSFGADQRALGYQMGAALSYIAGGFIAGAVLRADGSSEEPLFQLSGGDSQRTRLALRILTAGLCVSLLAIAGAGSQLWARDTYLYFEGGDAFMALLRMLLLPTAMGAGWALAVLRGPLRLIAAAVIVAAIIVPLGSASRMTALVFVLAGLGFLLGTEWSLPRRILFMLGLAVASLPVVAVPLVLRSRSRHGLLEYQNNGFGLGAAFSLEGARKALVNLSAPGMTTQAVLEHQVGSLPLSYLKISLSPLPGRWVGWYEISESLRINIFVPYNAVGELALHGWLPLILYFFVAGLVFGAMSIRTSHLLPVKLLGFGVAGLWGVTASQYNLRSSTRFLWAAVAITLIFLALDHRRLGNGVRGS